MAGGIYAYVYGIWRKRGMEVPEDYKKDSVLPGQVILGLADSRACSSTTTCLCRFGEACESGVWPSLSSVPNGPGRS